MTVWPYMANQATPEIPVAPIVYTASCPACGRDCEWSARRAMKTWEGDRAIDYTFSCECIGVEVAA